MLDTAVIYGEETTQFKEVKRSYKTSLMSFYNRIIDFIDKDDAVDTTYLELSKDFDSEPHGKLLAKIGKVQIIIIKWIRS